MALVRILLYVLMKPLLLETKGFLIKPNLSGKNVFSITHARLVTATVLPAILAISIPFVLMPLFSGNRTDQQTIQASFPTYEIKQMETLTSHQLKCSLSTSTLRSRLYTHFASVTYPQAILSLRGTFGDNGWYTSDVEVSLYATGDDSGSFTTEYALYNQGWATFTEPFIIFEEGQTAIYYRVRNDATGFVGETKFQTVDIDKTPPNGSVLIEGGDKDAFSTLVTLTLSVTDAPSGPTTPPPSGYIWGVPSGPAHMRFSNNGVFWSPWETVASSKSWTLETGAGDKAVYVQARDNAGLVSEIFSDTISLITTGDSLPPVTKITLSGKKDSSGVYTSTVAITLSAIDDLSGINLTEYSFGTNSWTKYTSPFTISAEGQTTIYYRSRDLAGNVESSNSQAIVIDKIERSDSTIPPPVVYIAVAAVAIGILVTVFVGRRQQNSRKTNRQERALNRQLAEPSFPLLSLNLQTALLNNHHSRFSTRKESIRIDRGNSHRP